MDVEPTADQRALRESVAAVLSKECPPALVRAVVEKQQPTAELWQRVVELGWPALTLPEAVGGLGLGPVEAGIVAEELGRAVAPLPWLATVTQYAAMVAEAGDEEQQQSLLEPVCEGAVTGALAVAEDGTRLLPAAPATTAEQVDGGWRLTGTKCAVFDVTGADSVVIVAAVGERLAAFVVETRNVTVVPTRSLDATRAWGDLRLDGVEVPAAGALGDPGSAETDAAVRRGLQHAVSGIAAETVGVCRGLLADTVAYASVRQQFGTPIGSFQAVQHKLADCHLAVERARATSTYAALCLAEDAADRALAVAAAKVASADAANRLARDALQTHGGIGYTWEHDLHLRLKRARADAVALGTAAAHRQDVADLLGLPA